jgi:riboflavin kinase/FMN adenylyltransferase
MKVIHSAADLNAGGRPVCAAIGVFDGVHLGHQEVLRRTISDAERSGAMSVVVTFDCHPNAVVAPAHVPPLIYPLWKKLEVLESLELNAVYIIHFDKAFSQIEGNQFVLGLARDFGKIQAISVGAHFEFGHRRSGNVDLLKAMGAKLGFAVNALDDLDLNGQPVSSTRIRDAVRAGDFASASAMLGRPYTLCGAVVEGEHLGRKLGFPTANLNIDGILTPPPGVYAADAEIRGEKRRAAVNIGHRPTVHSQDPKLHVEAHLLDFIGDIVGQNLELVFLKKLRDEQKFPSLESLGAQIAKDVAQARSFEPIFSEQTLL